MPLTKATLSGRDSISHLVNSNLGQGENHNGTFGEGYDIDLTSIDGSLIKREETNEFNASGRNRQDFVQTAGTSNSFNRSMIATQADIFIQSKQKYAEKLASGVLVSSSDYYDGSQTQRNSTI